MKVLIFHLLFFLMSYTSFAQLTFDHHYDFSGSSGTDRGGNMSWVGDGFIFPILSYCGNSTCFRFLKLTEEGIIEWNIDLFSDQEGALNPISDTYRLNDGTYATLYYKSYFAEGENTTIHWLNFDESGVLADFIVSDTTYSESIRGWEPTPDGFLAWIDRRGLPMVARKYAQGGEILAEWEHVEAGYDLQFSGNIVPLADGGYLYLNEYAMPGQRETLWGRRDAQGQLLWEHRNELLSHSNHSGENIIFTADSLVVVSEYLNENHPLSDHNGDNVIRAQNLAGDSLWFHSFDYRGVYGVSRIIPAANGDIIGVGYHYVEDWQGVEDDLRYGAWLFRMSAQGEILWERYFVGAQYPNQDYRFYDVVELPDGRIAMSGHYFDTHPNGIINADAWLLVTDEDGCLYPENCDEQDVLVSTDSFTSLALPADFAYFRLRQMPLSSTAPWQIDWQQDLPLQQAHFQLFGADGQLLASWPADTRLSPPANLSAGFYVLALELNGRVVQTEKVIVQ